MQRKFKLLNGVYKNLIMNDMHVTDIKRDENDNVIGLHCKLMDWNLAFTPYEDYKPWFKLKLENFKVGTLFETDSKQEEIDSFVTSSEDRGISVMIYIVKLFASRNLDVDFDELNNDVMENINIALENSSEEFEIERRKEDNMIVNVFGEINRCWCYSIEPNYDNQFLVLTFANNEVNKEFEEIITFDKCIEMFTTNPERDFIHDIFRSGLEEKQIEW